ncbi:MAG TPA: type II toxin-antitoxin system Phd/YefM family antitoxin [Proteobacteria bacterium]|nr:type II toxin-antitoxin system Phd/YefM family antitoxin [Pseudomonadota bacterium]
MFHREVKAMKTVTALDLRKKLGGILNDVSRKKEQVIISRANKPLAALISIDEYEEKILKKGREQKLKQILAKMDEWKKKHKKEIAHVDAVKAIREIREGR